MTEAVAISYGKYLSCWSTKGNLLILCSQLDEFDIDSSEAADNGQFKSGSHMQRNTLKSETEMYTISFYVKSSNSKHAH